MTQKAGKVVGRILVSNLGKALGETLEVCRSANERAKYPIYIRTKFGPVNFNNAAGQAALNEFADFYEAEERSLEEIPEPVPEVVERSPEEIPEPVPEPAPKKSGLMKLIFGGDE